jgi:hypothetical protein
MESCRVKVWWEMLWNGVLKVRGKDHLVYADWYILHIKLIQLDNRPNA